MRNTVFANVTIIGTSPLMWDKFNPTLMKPLPPEGDPSDWRRTVILAGDKLAIENRMLVASFREAAALVPNASPLFARLVAGAIQVPDAYNPLPFVLPVPLYASLGQSTVYLDVRAAKDPRTGERILRHRVATIAGWRLEFRLGWDHELLSQAHVITLLQTAGRFVGIGGGRTLGHGRFRFDPAHDFQLEDNL